MSDVTELWQLYDEQGMSVAGKGASKEDALQQALLHSAAHIWIWRRTEAGPEILLQKRSTSTWNGFLDISAAGHVVVSEQPVDAALREIKEEIGYAAKPASLLFFGIHRAKVSRVPGSDLTENEVRFLYLLEVPADATFSYTDGEVSTAVWKSLVDVRREVGEDALGYKYVPHSPVYFGMLFETLDRIYKS